MWVNNINPVLVHLGPLEIRWYGLVYVLGFFLCVYWLIHHQKKGALLVSKDEIWDLVFYLMLGVLVGARLFMIFWRPDIYLYHPWNLVKIWEGGMSFHGGFMGIIVACWLFCRKKKLNFWQIADILAAPTMFALALGRIANFINGELVGRPFNGTWCVIFPDYDQVCRHPNMIYSAAQRLMVFGWLLWLQLQRQFKPGFVFWNFVFWEGVGRFLMDFFREDAPSNYIAGLSLGQWFSSAMVIVALVIFIKWYRQDWKMLFFRQKVIKEENSF